MAQVQKLIDLNLKCTIRQFPYQKATNIGGKPTIEIKAFDS